MRQYFDEFARANNCPFASNPTTSGIVFSLAQLESLEDLDATLNQVDDMVRQYLVYCDQVVAPVRKAYAEARAKVDQLFDDLKLPKQEGVKVKRPTKAYQLLMDAVEAKFPYNNRQIPSEFVFKVLKSPSGTPAFAKAIVPSWQSHMVRTDIYRDDPLREVHNAPHRFSAVVKKMLFDHKKEQEAQNVERQRLVHAMDYVIRNNLFTLDEVANLADKHVVLHAQNHAQGKWLDANYPAGTEINIDVCSQCDSYVMGEHRCSCGNRRINVVAAGENGNYYLEVEAY